MSPAMTREEREQFLADVHVGIISIQEDGRGPLAVPVWYAYEPGGDVVVITGEGSRKAKLLEKAGRFSLCAQTETPPYSYVSVEGPVVSVEPMDVEKHRRPIAHRYLGPELGDRYLEATAAQDAELLIFRMRPAHWRTADYSKQFGSL